jgi:guanylate kinase
MAGQLLVVAGPSGVGKGTLVQRLCSRHGEKVLLSVSATTRPPRSYEVHGKDYLFWQTDYFREQIARGAFLEWTEYAGNLYGTPRQPVEQAIAQGKIVILEIEVEGARQVARTFPTAKRVFIMPPSLEVLEQRLRSRCTEDEASIKLRLERAKQEIACAGEFDQVIVNDDLETATKQLERSLGLA